MNIKMLKLAVIPLMVLALAACGGVMGKGAGGGSGASGGAADNSTNTLIGGDLIGGGANSGAGYGANIPGTGSLTAPTAEAVVARLKNGLEGNANPLAGNFARSLAQVRSNLPKLTDPMKVTGFDQVQLLAYAACSDLTVGNTPRMQTQYGVTRAGTITAQTAALSAAGMKILDAHLAGLASASAATPKVQAALSTLIQKVNVAGNNSTIAFMAVCIAANTAGSSMMGF